MNHNIITCKPNPLTTASSNYVKMDVNHECRTKAMHMHMEKCKLQFAIYEDGEKNGKGGNMGRRYHSSLNLPPKNL